MFRNPELLKRIGIGLAALIAGFLVGTFVLSIPMPTVTDARAVDGTAIVSGTTRPGAAVIAFDAGGAYLATVIADDGGAFRFDGLPYATGTAYAIRAMKGNWQASPARNVVVTGSDGAPTVSVVQDVTGEELPPGIPPTSSRPAESSATSTDAAKMPEAITATASVSNMKPKPGSSVTLTVDVRDETGSPVAGATVAAVVHDTTADVTHALKPKGGAYVTTVRIPTGAPSGASVVIDVSASYRGLSSTARVVLQVK